MSRARFWSRRGAPGGHLFPAEALATRLARAAIAVELVTDARGKKYGGDFPARAVHIDRLPPRRAAARASPAPWPPLTLRAGTLGRASADRTQAASGRWSASAAIRACRPFSPRRILACRPSCTKNAVMGRANLFLAAPRRCHRARLSRRSAARARSTPRRSSPAIRCGPAVIEAAKMPYPDVSVTANSICSSPAARRARGSCRISCRPPIALLSPQERAELVIVQQARGEDEARVAEAYAAARRRGRGRSLLFRSAGAHRAAPISSIARAGASTVSELAVIGRPAILVPFPHALDQDQAANAAAIRRERARRDVVDADAILRRNGSPSALT